MNDSVFKSRLTNVMTDNQYDRRVKGRTKGKLDMRSLPKASMGSRGVFTEKTERKGKRYNIALLIDESGSMGHPGWGEYKIDKAGEIATFLAEQFASVNIDISIIGFNANINVHKDFGGKKMSKAEYKALKEEIERHANDYDIITVRPDGTETGECALGCNHDHKALETAYERMAGLKGENIVIFLSDGLPACTPGDGCGYDTAKHETEAIHRLVKENERIAKTIGVGIFHTPYQIPNHMEVYDRDAVKPKILEILKREIKRK